MIFETAPSPKTKYLSYLFSAIVGITILVVGYVAVGFSYQFHGVIGFALAFTLLLPALIVHWETWRKKRIDEALPRLLDDIGGSYESGMTLMQALEECTKRSYGPITVELKKLTAQLSWGVEFEAAFKSFAARINTALTTRATILIIESVRLGGDLKSTFNSTARFFRQIIALRKERESQLRSYLMIIYASSLIFLLIIVILYQSFFLPMAAQQTRFLQLQMSLGDYKSLLFDLAIVEAFFGGLTAGKLSQGVTLAGLKHSVILIALTSVVLLLLF